MKQKNTLQNLTKSPCKKTQQKINKILALERIEPKDIKHLNDKEHAQFMKIITDKFNESKGEARDSFWNKIEAITTKSTKNQLWEYNHQLIMWAISKLMQQKGRMPAKTELAKETELSRQTIHTHLKEYSNHPLHLGQMEQFRFMASQVLTRVYQMAINGDIGAAKLYINVFGTTNSGQFQNNTLIQNQNNYIQINGTVLSQEKVKNLNPEQLNSIETILKTALSE